MAVKCIKSNCLSVVVPISFFIISLMGCESNDITGVNNQFVDVKIDLQIGFDGHSVLLKFNGEDYYQANLSELVSLAGPIATFSTTLPRGNNNCYAFWRSLKQTTDWEEDSVLVFLGEADKYFLGYQIVNDTLNIIVQDSAFLYL